ncbi:MAG: hypothetical protein D6722_23455, partial [Bacteroidetes bacterium]
MLVLMTSCTAEVFLPPLLRGITQLEGPERQVRVVAVMDSLEAAGQIPLIVGDTVYYLLRQEADRVTLAGDLNGWDPEQTPMRRLAGTDLWYQAFATEAEARLTYKYVIDGETWVPDPHNPRLDEVGEYDNSLLQMPDYVPPPEVAYYPDLPHGRLDTLPVDTQAWPQCRHLLVYTPPGYDRSAQAYPTAYFHDGLNQVKLAKMPNILDYLIDQGQIQPIIAVLIEPADRNRDYAFEGRFDFAALVAQEVVPWVDD